MAFSGIALVALAAAQAAAPASSGVKWTPLQAPAQTQPVAAPAPILAPATPQAVILSSPSESVLRAGTEVPLRVLETLNSNNKSLREGARIRMEVAQSVMLGGMVVIPAGSLATAEVTEV